MAKAQGLSLYLYYYKSKFKFFVIPILFWKFVYIFLGDINNLSL